MSPRTLSAPLLRQVQLLKSEEPLSSAVAKIIEEQVPALPVVDANGKLTGIFGERELITAMFPGYLRELRYAAFVTEDVQSTLELRECGNERVGDHMNTEHIDVPSGYSDSQIAEVFLHHRVLIIPVADGGEVKGIVTRWDFFKALSERLSDPR